LAAIEYPIDASPWPDRSPLMVTQLVAVEMVQVQSRVVATVKVAFPPFAEKLDVDVLARTSHRAVLAVGALSEVSAEVHAVWERIASKGIRIRPNISNIRGT
jgi:Flp pilus assembly pilin Flp